MSGVPFFIRAGKHLATTQTEFRLIFNQPPMLGLQRRGQRRLEDNQLTIRLDPATGIRFDMEAKRADALVPEPIDLEMEFANEGGEGATPYEVLLHAALIGDSMRFTRQDGVEETWRVMQPLLDNPPPIHTYKQSSWGPQAADALVADFGGWRQPWMGS
jgi:glucose-6-phosphate 1-dehydrogenase